MQKPCTCCGEEKPLDAYRFNERTGRYAVRCVECGDGDGPRSLNYAHRSIKNLLRKRIGTAKSTRRRWQVKITIDELMEVYEAQAGRCAVTGVLLTHEYETPYTNVSIDRIDCNGPYEVGNVRLICNVVNIMRGRLSDEELLRWCQAIVDGYGRAD